jgi:hypothetical protein
MVAKQERRGIVYGKWRVVLKMGGKVAGGRREWSFEAHAPVGKGRYVSRFETVVKYTKEELVREILGKVEKLLGVLAPGGMAGNKE